jgi:hypothetical protein
MLWHLQMAKLSMVVTPAVMTVLSMSRLTDGSSPWLALTMATCGWSMEVHCLAFVRELTLI